jgi:D-alanyl-D-alanine carboxypeptidase
LACLAVASAAVASCSPASLRATSPSATPAIPASAGPTLTQATAAQIDALMRRAVAQQHLAGISLAIGHNGTVIFAKGYGYRDLAKRLPATPETIYNIASMSKQFTAACVLLLQQDGKLNIDDHLSKYLRGFPNGDKITIRQVLDHTSGLTDYLDLVDNSKLTPATVNAAIYKLKLKFPPGSKYEYSNSNYIVAGLIVTRVSGMPFDEFVRKRIFTPLGLRSTSVGTSPLDLPGGAVGYTVVKGRTIPVDPNADSATTLDFPDGAVNTTVLDLITWDYALDSGRVLDPAMLKLMFTPSGLRSDWPGGYALGVGLDSVAGHREVAHTGDWTGFTGENATLPDERFAVVMVTNTDTFDWGGKVDLIQRIIRLFYH